MSRARALAAGAVLLGAAAAALPLVRGLGGGGGVPVLEVVRSDFGRRVEAEGNLEAVRATPLNAPMEASGPLKIAWLAPDGSRVREGDVVIRFDPTEMEKSLVDGEAERQSAVNKTQGRRAEGEGTSRNLARDAEVADLELRYAREFQSKDPVIFSRVDIIESQIDEGLAAERKENAEAVRKIRDDLTRVDLDLIAIDRRKADLKIDEARTGLLALEVRAPHDGIFVLKRDWRGTAKVGDTVWQGQPIAEIPDLGAMKARVYVLEADAGGLAVGVPARVVVESRPDRDFAATVDAVDALAKPRVSWVPVQYFGVTLALERTDPGVMKPGQRVRAVLTLDGRKDAIAVPREAVFEKDGKKIVHRRSGWGFEPVEVVLGPAASGRVVIDKRLSPGDVVALRAPGRPAGAAAPPGGGTENAMPAPGASR